MSPGSDAAEAGEASPGVWSGAKVTRTRRAVAAAMRAAAMAPRPPRPGPPLLPTAAGCRRERMGARTVRCIARGSEGCTADAASAWKMSGAGADTVGPAVSPSRVAGGARPEFASGGEACAGRGACVCCSQQAGLAAGRQGASPLQRPLRRGSAATSGSTLLRSHLGPSSSRASWWNSALAFCVGRARSGWWPQGPNRSR